MKNPILNTTLLTKKQFETELFNRFGLKPDYNKITKYMDTYSCNKFSYSVDNPLVFTISFIDNFGFSWANVYGQFYKNHTKPKTQLFKDFKEFINSNTYKYSNHFLIN